MPLIDDRGRLFGKWNVIDVAVVVVVLLMLPIAYGAYVLFRTPVPVITTVEPKQIPVHQPATVRITGDHFRAFLRARVGTTDGPFLIQSPTAAEIKLPETLDAGSYDLTLYDESRELIRLPGAITIAPPPPPPPGATLELQAVGRFVSLPSSAVPHVSTGTKLLRGAGASEGPVAEVLAVRGAEAVTQQVRTGPPTGLIMSVPAAQNVVQMPAILRITCVIVGQQCKIGDAVVMQGAALTLASTPADAKDGLPGSLTFQVEAVRSADTAPTFPPTPEADVQAVGAFVSLQPTTARQIRTGLPITLSLVGPGVNGTIGTILAVKAPEASKQRIAISEMNVIDTTVPGALQVPAILRLRCVVINENCSLTQNVFLQRGLTIAFNVVGHAPVPLAFRVDDIRPARTPLMFPSDRTNVIVRARLLVQADVVQLVHAGDVDRYGTASLESLGTTRETIRGTNIWGPLQVQQDLIAVDGTFRVPATIASGAWQYAGRPLRAGEIFSFETERYGVSGPITDVQFSRTRTSSTQ